MESGVVERKTHGAVAEKNLAPTTATIANNHISDAFSQMSVYLQQFRQNSQQALDIFARIVQMT